jgi:hypothetical protein
MGVGGGGQIAQAGSGRMRTVERHAEGLEELAQLLCDGVSLFGNTVCVEPWETHTQVLSAPPSHSFVCAETIYTFGGIL